DHGNVPVRSVAAMALYGCITPRVTRDCHSARVSACEPCHKLAACDYACTGPEVGCQRSDKLLACREASMAKIYLSPGLFPPPVGSATSVVPLSCGDEFPILSRSDQPE